jgi:hypothetical protein
LQLTTIRAPLFELGRKAAEILIRNIESHEPLPIEKVVLNAEFVVRESTRSLRPSGDGQIREAAQEAPLPEHEGTI